MVGTGFFNIIDPKALTFTEAKARLSGCFSASEIQEMVALAQSLKRVTEDQYENDAAFFGEVFDEELLAVLSSEAGL